MTTTTMSKQAFPEVCSDCGTASSAPSISCKATLKICWRRDQSKSVSQVPPQLPSDLTWISS